MIPKSSDSTFWQTVCQGANDAGKEFDIDIIIKSPLNENDIEKQILIVEEAIEDKVDAIVLAATDYYRLANVVEKAVDNGIPVVAIDSNVNSDKVSTFVGTNSNEAAIMAAERLVKLIGGRGKVAVVSFVKETSTAKEREYGALQVLGSNKNIDIVDKVYTLSDEIIAKEEVMKLLNENPDIDGIIALNGPSSTGAARAVEELGFAGKVKVVAFDNTQEEIDYLEDDALQATVIQDPYNIGYLGVKYAYEILMGIEVPRSEYTESTIVDKENMYLPKNQKLLFPFVK